MADHQHGSMSTKSNEATFAGFITFVKWGVIITICILIFMALTNA